MPFVKTEARQLVRQRKHVQTNLTSIFYIRNIITKLVAQLDLLLHLITRLYRLL